jgi:hypothetical protein
MILKMVYKITEIPNNKVQNIIELITQLLTYLKLYISMNLENKYRAS